MNSETLVAIINAHLQRLMPRNDSEFMETAPLVAAISYACLSPGKRFRPVLCLLSAHCVGRIRAEFSEAELDAAAALEMVHAFSLIHDDLPAIDNDALRRGRPTCHIKFGEAVAILAGDALFALAFETLANIPLAPQKVVSLMRLLSHAAGVQGLVGGEVADVLSEGKVPTEGLVEFVHSKKTGILIAASAAMGGVVGGGNADEVEALRAYGEAVGLAFQIADDVLNETGNPDQLGKAVGSDKDRLKATYPAVHGLDGAIAAAHEAVERSLIYLERFGTRADPLREIAQFSVERLS